MSKIDHAWPSNSFDAIAILAIEGQFEIEGTDEDQVKLEAQVDRRALSGLSLDPAGRWLQLQLWEYGGEAQFTLRLPTKKNWVVDVSAAQGDVRVSGVSARLRVMLGKGDIQIENCKGIFGLASGKGDVKLDGCVEAEMPGRPPAPEAQFQSAGAPEPPPMPGEPGAAGEFHAHFGPGMHRRVKSNLSWDWIGFDGDDWAEWGSQMGEQARVWAQRFAGQFLGSVDWQPEKAAVAVRIGKGDAKLQEIEAKKCSVKLANGDVEVKGGRFGELQVRAAHGDIKCERAMPAGDWEIDTKNGNIQIGLPSNAQARLDVATRHGDIDSQVPLMRVGRPGPESRFGGRMVGTVGQPGQDLASLTVTTVRGDVEIRLEPTASRFSGKPGPAAATAQTQTTESTAPTSSPSPTSTTSENAATVTKPAEATTIEADKQAQVATAAAYDSQLSILQALSAGQITVEEAEKLLESLKRGTKSKFLGLGFLER